MDFKDYCREKQHSPCCSRAEAFKLGQQSKQAEIDKIKELLNQWDNWISVSANNNRIEIVKECADELRELLK